MHECEQRRAQAGAGVLLFLNRRGAQAGGMREEASASMAERRTGRVTNVRQTAPSVRISNGSRRGSSCCLSARLRRQAYGETYMHDFGTG